MGPAVCGGQRAELSKGARGVVVSSGAAKGQLGCETWLHTERFLDVGDGQYKGVKPSSVNDACFGPSCDKVQLSVKHLQERTLEPKLYTLIRKRVCQ